VKILTSEQMKRVEAQCALAGTPSSVLMENAGRAVAEEVRRTVGDGFRRVLVLTGPGNNGGDGEVAARYLKGWGYDVSLYMLGHRPAEDKNLVLATQAGVSLVKDAAPTSALVERSVQGADVVIDAVFGTGFKAGRGGQRSRPLSREVTAVFNLVKRAKEQRDLALFALDVPSGLDADTGGVDEACLFADETVVLGYSKPGLFNMPGAERAGKIKIVDIGIPPDLAQDGVAELMTGTLVRSVLPRRPIVANKGTFGRVMVVAGSTKYVGAACLACSAALRVGAGLVTLATSVSLQAILASKLTEVTYLPLSESTPGVLSLEAASEVTSGIQGYDVLLIGSGLGQHESAVNITKSLLLDRDPSQPPCVVDADALNILSGLSLTEQVWRRLGSDVILTPHPGEMSRLTGISVEEIQRDRLAVAARAARDWHKTVVLKGAYTVVAAADGRLAVSPFANAAMASAGTGDVLAGAIAGFAAQGLSPFEAALVGVYVHGKAGELVARELGDAGVIAGDIQERLPAAIKEIKGG
jgi:hydroxyethylthiazole kinase-like uncharacterized protein yjeF